MFYRETHGVFMAQAATGIEGVFDMGLHGIGIVEYRGHATLGPEGRAVGQVALAQYGNAQVAGKAQGQAQAGRAAANHEYIMLILLAHFRIPRKATLQACLSGSSPLVYRGGDRHNSRAFMAMWNYREAYRAAFIAAAAPGLLCKPLLCCCFSPVQRRSFRTTLRHIGLVIWELYVTPSYP
ncbi:hypothetical protein D9M71_594560 [compost metagenome]